MLLVEVASALQVNIDVKNVSVDLGRIRNMFKSNAGFPVALETIFPDTYKQGRKSLCWRFTLTFIVKPWMVCNKKHDYYVVQRLKSF